MDSTVERTTTTTVAIRTPSSEAATSTSTSEFETRETLFWSSASLDKRPVGAPRPVRVKIPALDVAADIVATGVDENGQMAVPGNVSEVAWYSFGAIPGETGSAVLAAHVDLADSGPGVFFDLETMRFGDEVTITFEGGAEEVFSVIDSERIPKTELDLASLFAESGPELVRLVTCGGGFNPELRRYEDNVVVTLEPSGRALP